MFRPLAAYIGLRNVRAKTHQSFISFISFISMLGIILGVAILITVLSVMNGFEQQLKIKILGIVPQASVSSVENIKDWQQLAQFAQQQDSNIQAVAPFNHTQAMISTKTSAIQGVMLTGIIPQYEREVSVIDQQIIAGQLDSLNQPQTNIIIGKKLAESLKVGMGDKVNIIIPEGTTAGVGVVPKYHQFTVTGIFQLSPSAEKVLTYVPLQTVNTVLSRPDGAQGIRFKLNDVFLAKQTAKQAATLQSGLSAQDWTQTNGQMFKIIRMQKAMVAMILLFIILVASFNLVSSLIMAVTEKKSEIAILKTFGASRSLIVRIFVVQGGSIAIVGTIIGGILGVILALNVGALSNWVNTTFKLDLFVNYYVTQLPSQLRPLEVLLVMFGSGMLAVLATIYPAFKAASIRPVVGLATE